MSKHDDRDPDAGPEYAYWLPEEAIRNLTFEKQMHGHETHAQLAKRLMEENLPLMVMGMTHIGLNEPDARTRLTAQKYLIDYTMGVAKTGVNGDLPDGKEPWTKVYDAVMVEQRSAARKRD